MKPRLPRSRCCIGGLALRETSMRQEFPCQHQTTAFSQTPPNSTRRHTVRDKQNEMVAGGKKERNFGRSGGGGSGSERGVRRRGVRRRVVTTPPTRTTNNKQQTSRKHTTTEQHTTTRTSNNPPHNTTQHKKGIGKMIGPNWPNHQPLTSYSG